MTPKELLIREIEQVADPVIEEMLDFLLLAKMKHHRAQAQKQPFATFIEELVADIPPQVLDKLPTDGAVEHDHYLYGTSKKGLPIKQPSTMLVKIQRFLSRQPMVSWMKC